MRMRNLFACVAVAAVGVTGCVSVGEQPAGETCRAVAAGDAFEVDTVRVYDIVRSGK